MISRVDHIAGHTYHGRKGAVQNAFRYSFDYVMIDAEAEVRGPSLFSRTRGAIAALHDKDHGGAPKQGRGATRVREVLDSHQIRLTGRIVLLAQPKLLGHVFNPVSFWLIHDEDDALCAVIAEVTNTYGDRHSYLCHRADLRPITSEDRLTSRKVLHVSPFQEVEGGYTFRFDISDDRIGIWIDYTRGNGGLIATLAGPRRALTNRGILGALLRRPFGSRRVLFLIHWQALRLWWKGARFRSRPAAPEAEVSR